MGYIVYEFNRMKMFNIIYVKYIHLMKETDKGVLFDIEGKQVWLPKSMIAIDFTNKIIALPGVVAVKNGILESRVEPVSKLDGEKLLAMQQKNKVMIPGVTSNVEDYRHLNPRKKDKSAS